jgi:hypothetical protein
VSGELVPFRVPAGWAVVYNSFFDDNLDEDLLWLKQVGIPHPGAQYAILDEEGYQIDLGWYRDVFRVVVMRRNWDDVLFDVTAAERDAVVRALEQILEWLARGLPPAEVCAKVGGRPR